MEPNPTFSSSNTHDCKNYQLLYFIKTPGMEPAPGSSELRKSVFTACQHGDIPALKLLFQEYDINPDHPKTAWDMPGSLPEGQRPPCVVSMLATASQHCQIPTVTFLYTTFRNAANEPLATAIETGDVELVRAMCKFDPRGRE